MLVQYIFLDHQTAVTNGKNSPSAGAGLNPCYLYDRLIFIYQNNPVGWAEQVGILLFSFYSPSELAFLLNITECFRVGGRFIQTNCNYISSH
jgi:hypothetical protein